MLKDIYRNVTHEERIKEVDVSQGQEARRSGDMAIFGMAARHVAPLLSLRYQKAYPPKRPTLLNQRIGRIVMCIQGKGL